VVRSRQLLKFGAGDQAQQRALEQNIKSTTTWKPNKPKAICLQAVKASRKCQSAKSRNQTTVQLQGETLACFCLDHQTKEALARLVQNSHNNQPFGEVGENPTDTERSQELVLVREDPVGRAQQAQLRLRPSCTAVQ
jgi:hypothetical protein